MKTIEFYIAKEKRLQLALDRVKLQLDRFSKGLRKDTDLWNDFHDLEYRIEERIKDNYYESKSMLFEKNGWVAY